MTTIRTINCFNDFLTLLFLNVRLSSLSNMCSSVVLFVFLSSSFGIFYLSIIIVICNCYVPDYILIVAVYEDIAYSFLVGEDGRIYEGRGWNKVGAHSYRYNSRSYGISFIGNYNFTLPNNAALNGNYPIYSNVIVRFCRQN